MVCMYQLVYLLLVLGLTFIFCALIIFNILKSRYSKISKLLAQYAVLLFLTGLGTVLAEAYIDNLRIYDCSSKENVALTAMIFATASTLMVSYVCRKKKYIVGPRANWVLAVMGAGLLLAVVVAFAVEIFT